MIEMKKNCLCLIGFIIVGVGKAGKFIQHKPFFTCKVWGQITYPFLNLNGCTVED